MAERFYKKPSQIVRCDSCGMNVEVLGCCADGVKRWQRYVMRKQRERAKA